MKGYNKFVNARQQAGWTSKSFAFSGPLQKRYMLACSAVCIAGLMPVELVAEEEFVTPPLELSNQSGSCEEGFHMSYGALRSPNYYWVRANSKNKKRMGTEQETAELSLKNCRTIFDEKTNNVAVPLGIAEEEIRKCMLSEEWSRKFTCSLNVF